MSFSLGPKGGLQDPIILRLLAELTTLIKAHGSSNSDEVVKFIEENKNTTFVDELSQHMHTFKEVAEAMGPLIQGIKMEPKEERDLPGDGWKSGSAEDIFGKKDPDDPASWWKK
mgnify:FL=1|jgi:hypothetical protein